MTRITVLSPHRDDAAFSLSLSLLRWRELGMKITVLNFFTVSAYAPRIPDNDPDQVSLVRKAEDHRVLSQIDRRIRVRDCNLLDAPIRLGIRPDAICNPETQAFAKSIVPEVAAYIRSQEPHGAVIAPLGLGGHVDHLAVHEAATTKMWRKHRLAFYEDLPYATWTADEILRDRVLETETKLHTRLKPAIIRRPRAVFRKRSLIAGYRSQIAPEEAWSIARFSLRYGGGERLWVPNHSKLWALLTE